MKPIKTLISGLCAAAVALTVSASAGAIDFDAEKAMDSTFVVYDAKMLGSGFAVGENIIITNAHVALGAEVYFVYTDDQQEYEAYLVAYDRERDLAALAVGDDVTLKPLPLRDHMEMNVGDEVYAIGSPKGLYYTLTKGVISTMEREIDGSVFLQHDAVTYGGNSGGPLFDDEGNIIGVTSYKAADVDGLSFAIPATDVVTFLNSIGLETDENGNVIGRVELKPEYSHTNPTLSDDEEEEPDDKPQSKSWYQLTAWDASVIATVVGLVSLVFNAVLMLALRRTNERLRLSNTQKRASAKKDDGEEKASQDEKTSADEEES
ncbi:MAG: trypsin-like peptidase domain-containing protein [Eubacterium sp.]|nr:trypsin-like peptidase domain-containing protein [Eubacterium sp.]